jgi:hypothetical protein
LTRYRKPVQCVAYAMTEYFGQHFSLALKALSISRAQMAADLRIDKSVVGRWATGAARPSDHNLARLTGLVARHHPGFTALDWDRSPGEFAALFGAAPQAATAPALPLAILEQVLATTTLRGAAYEGFFRSTRPYVLKPGLFVHDHGMIRRADNGLLSLRMGTAGTIVEGWFLPLHNQLFCIAADVTSGALLFGIFHGVATARAQVLDGLALTPALDPGRTPTAHAMMFERIGDLSGDVEADNAHLAKLMTRDPLAPEGSISDELRSHLLRDIGPAQLLLGGDMLLQLPLSRSKTRGPDYGEHG